MISLCDRMLPWEVPWNVSAQDVMKCSTEKYKLGFKKHFNYLLDAPIQVLFLLDDHVPCLHYFQVWIEFVLISHISVLHCICSADISNASNCYQDPSACTTYRFAEVLLCTNEIPVWTLIIYCRYSSQSAWETSSRFCHCIDHYKLLLSWKKHTILWLWGKCKKRVLLHHIWAQKKIDPNKCEKRLLSWF